VRPGRKAASVVTLVLLVACAAEGPGGDAQQIRGTPVVVNGGEYRDLTVPELQLMLEDKDFPLINVHIPFEGDLPGTDDSFPFNEIESNIHRLPEDRDARIVLYCRTGPMSASAAAELVRLGYTDVYHLVGGMVAWTEWGLPMATP